MIQISPKREQKPVALPLGGLTLVLPSQERRLTPKQWADLGCAVILDFEGEADQATALIADLEDRLGVHQAHRRACVSSPEEVRRLIASTAQRRTLTSEMRAVRLAGASRLPEPTEEIERLVKRAGREDAKAETLRRKNARLHSDDIRAHRTTAKRCRMLADQMRQDQLHQHWASQAIGESTDYAMARGEEVVEEVVNRGRFETDEDGVRLKHRRDARPSGLDRPGHRRGDAVLVVEQTVRRRVMTRGGLKLAYERGDLDEGRGAKHEMRLRDTGLRYQACYERLPGFGSSPEPNDGGRSSRDPARPFGQETATDARQDLAIMRDPLSDREREVLDLICGRDFTLGAAAADLKAGIPTTRRALRSGLSAAARALHAARVKSET